MTNLAKDHQRSIRSYVIRSGRLDDKKKLLIDNLYPKYGIPIDINKTKLNKQISNFPNTHLEIGFGNGDSLLHYSQLQNTDLHIGFEVYKVGIARTLKKIEELAINNLKVINADAVDVLKKFEQNSIASIRLFFPDPWIKKRHQKRRIVNLDFLASVAKILKPNGIFHMATDAKEYANEVISLITQDKNFELLNLDAKIAQEITAMRIDTKFAQRANQDKRAATDLVIKKL